MTSGRHEGDPGLAALTPTHDVYPTVSATTTLGSTNVVVTRLGLGTGPLGGWPAPVSSAEARDTIDAAWDVGVRYFDTAPLYGYGQAENYLGQALAHRPRAAVTVSTKVGRLLEVPDAPEDRSFFHGTGTDLRPVFDFSREGVLRSFDSSLARTGLGRFDVLLIHDPDHHLDAAAEGAFGALAELRASGIIGAIGAGMNRTRPLVHLMERLDLDCVMIAGRYSLLDQDAVHELLPTATRRGVSVLVAGVFNSGILAKPGPGATYDYVPAAPELVVRVDRLREVASAHGVSLAAAAMRFPFTHPSVASVVIGARGAARVIEDADLLEVAIPERFWADLRAEGLLDPAVEIPEANRTAPASPGGRSRAS